MGSLPHAPPLPAGPDDLLVPRKRRFYSNVLPLCLAALLALLVARELVAGRATLAVAPAAVLAVLLLSARTWLPYVAVLAGVASVAEPYAYPQFAFAGVNPFLSELLLGLAFAAAALALPRVRRYASHEPQTISIALGIFFLAALMGAGVGKAAGLAPITIFNDMREVAFFATFWLALVALRRPQARQRVFWLATGLAVVVVALQFAQFAVGTSHILFYTKSYATNLITCPTGQCEDLSAASFLRVRPPGLRLVYVVAAFAACYCLFGPRRRRGLALGVLGACLAGLFLSLNRNLLGGLALGLAVAVLVSPRKSRVLAALVATAAVILVLIPVEQSGALGSATPVLSRFSTLAKPSEVAGEGSLKQRSLENRLALQAIRHHPLEGIGWGVSYGRRVTVVNGAQIRTTDQLFIHDLYLGLWMRTGLLGLVAYLAAIGAALTYGVRWCRSRRFDDRTWIGAGVVASVVAVSVSSAVDIGTDPEKVVPLMAVLALAVTLAREMRAATGRG
jgi:O-antigen ligase